jgi:phenylacetic acid degradation operon negative regulatory protein
MFPERNDTSDRPLSARSLIASLLLRTSPPRMAGRRLVQWCGLFGIPEGTTRVALSRMVDRDELRADAGVYELVGRVSRRRSAQDFSLQPSFSDWNGAWRIAVVDGGAARLATQRAALRDAMRRLRYGELREGVWNRPDNLPRASAPNDAWSVADEQCMWWTATPEEDAVALAARLFGTAEWARSGRAFVERLTSVTRRLTHNDDRTLADAFVVGARAVAHLRADPLLPRELCPDGWPGEALRGAYVDFEPAFAHALQRWFRRQSATAR